METKVKEIRKIKNDIKENFVNFSELWSSYVETCQDKKSPDRFLVTKKHPAYELLINELPKNLSKLFDNKQYKIVSSVGDGNLAGIPWLCILDKNVTNSVTNNYYIAFLFSRNAKKLYISINMGAQQFFDLHGENNECIQKIKFVKEKIEQEYAMDAPSGIFENPQLKEVVSTTEQFENYKKANAFSTPEREKNFLIYDLDEIYRFLPDEKGGYGGEKPESEFAQMDLYQKNDQNFIRNKFSRKMQTKVLAYEQGSIFAKEYSFENYSTIDTFKRELFGDLRKYARTYEHMKTDALEEFIEIISERNLSIIKSDLDYKVQEFKPSKSKSKTKKISRNKEQSSNSKEYYPKETQKTGNAGEKHVFEYEKNKLIKNGRDDLASKVKLQSEDKSHYPGYDIKSYAADGTEMLIEVKSSKGKNPRKFYITENEWNAAKKYNDKFWIYIVEKALKEPKIIHRINNPSFRLEKGEINLTVNSYKLDI